MRIFQVDAFADRPFGGNPAGVCVVGAGADPGWMQAVASEMNVAETAFLSPLGEGRYGLRWFTPAVEVDLCGHATLASAHLLWEEGEPAAELAFETRSGVLRAVRAGDGGIRLDFPADPPVPIDPPAGLAAALGVEPVGVHRGVSDVLVEVADSGTVRRLTPDLRALAAIPARGVIVTAAGSGSDGDAPTDGAAGADFVSRCFYPAAGVDEDPVTGSAHCTLASFWCARLGRSSLVGWQASARGGRVGVELAGDRVLLTGRAVTVLRGDLV
ncbi:MAG TPA: PhzF family phenazine biosynthesis protein [Acidimicrobiia bacterium]|nr:PhzF family phenazine biosynthesis protein [Acidimicrobiia bacterium]